MNKVIISEISFTPTLNLIKVVFQLSIRLHPHHWNLFYLIKDKSLAELNFSNVHWYPFSFAVRLIIPIYFPFLNQFFLYLYFLYRILFLFNSFRSTSFRYGVFVLNSLYRSLYTYSIINELDKLTSIKKEKFFGQLDKGF